MANPLQVDYKAFKFHHVIDLQNKFSVLDLSQGEKKAEPPVLLDNFLGRKYPANAETLYTIGRYNERRPSTYVQDLFKGRNIHVGIDIGAPRGTPVHTFFMGEVFLFADNQEPGDYGPTLITRHNLDGVWLYSLYGHLSRTSLLDKKVGQILRTGEVIGWVGDNLENGGWPPHLHFQLSFLEPKVANMPGVVDDKDLEWALKTFPDPRNVLGPIY
jgi:murein DD-endopeptidase MepM/ murein hydrolase activator NlpD